MTPFSSCSNTSRCSCLPIESPRHERAEANLFYCDLSKLLTLRTARIINWLCFYVTKPRIVFFSAIVNGTVLFPSFVLISIIDEIGSFRLPSSMCCYVCHLSWHNVKPTATHIAFTYSCPSGRTEESRDFHLAALLYQGGEISPG